MVKNILVIGLTIKFMEVEFISTKTVVDIKDNFIKIWDKDMVFIKWLLEIDIVVTGKIIEDMVKECNIIL